MLLWSMMLWRMLLVMMLLWVLLGKMRGHLGLVRGLVGRLLGKIGPRGEVLLGRRLLRGEVKRRLLKRVLLRGEVGMLLEGKQLGSMLLRQILLLQRLRMLLQRLQMLLLRELVVLGVEGPAPGPSLRGRRPGGRASGWLGDVEGLVGGGLRRTLFDSSGAQCILQARPGHSHCTALHCTALHCTALNCTAL
jgi:hypothetical protein